MHIYIYVYIDSSQRGKAMELTSQVWIICDKTEKVGAMGQHVGTLLAMPASHISLSSPLSANVHGKAADDGLVLGAYHPCDSWLWSDSAVVIASIWGSKSANTRYISLFVSSPSQLFFQIS